MQRAALFPMVRAETLRLLGGYVQSPAVLEHIDEYIVAPALFPVSGLVGSYLIGSARWRNGAKSKGAVRRERSLCFAQIPAAMPSIRRCSCSLRLASGSYSTGAAMRKKRFL